MSDAPSPDGKFLPISVMLNESIKGKMPSGATREDWQKYNSSFVYTPITPYGLASDIWRGYSFCPVFHRRRKKENFKAAHHIAFDFDRGDASLDALSNHEFINIFSSFAYSTPSSTPDNPRSRVVFIFDQPYTNIAEYEQLYQALLWSLELPADPSCKDALRLFYGSPGCKVWTNWSILPRKSADFVVAEWIAAHPAPVVKDTLIIPPADSGRLFGHVLSRLGERIAAAIPGERHKTVNTIAYTIGGYVAGGYISEGDAFAFVGNAIRRMITSNPDHHLETATQAIRDGQQQPIYLSIEQAPSLSNVL